MKIVKTKKANAYTSIKNSMDSTREIAIESNLDACGCTGNGMC